MSTFGRSSAAYLARSGLAPTPHAPATKFVPGDHPIHRYPVAPPYPLAQFLYATQGSPPPDRGKTTAWPHGS